MDLLIHRPQPPDPLHEPHVSQDLRLLKAAQPKRHHEAVSVSFEGLRLVQRVALLVRGDQRVFALNHVRELVHCEDEGAVGSNAQIRN